MLFCRKDRPYTNYYVICDSTRFEGTKLDITISVLERGRVEREGSGRSAWPRATEAVARGAGRAANA